MDDITPEKLYNDFRASLRAPGSVYFDEDDIIDIFDYAADNNDDYIRLEALLYAARMFPDSREMADRRNYFYYYLGIDDAVEDRLDAEQHPSPLAQLLKIRIGVDDLHSASALERFLATMGDKLTDEEAIQLAASAAATKPGYAWMTANVRRIADRCDSPVTFIFEVANYARERGDAETALKMAEELTMLEPFNVEFWELQASLLIDLERYAEAISAADYALAIDPSAPESLRMKGYAIYKNKGDDREAYECLNKAFSPDMDVRYMHAYCIVASDEPEEEMIANAFTYLDNHPNDAGTLGFVGALGFFDEFRRRMQLMTTPELEGENQTIEPASFYAWGIGSLFPDPELAAMIFDEAKRREERVPAFIDEVPVGGYEIRSYNMVLIPYEKVGETLGNSVPMWRMAVIMSLVRLGRRDEALARTRKFIDELQSLPSVLVEQRGQSFQMARMITQNFRAALGKIQAALESPEEFSADDIDPFREWGVVEE